MFARHGVVGLLGAFALALTIGVLGGCGGEAESPPPQPGAEAGLVVAEPAELIVRLDDLPGGFIAIIEDTGPRALSTVLDRDDLTASDRELIEREWRGSHQAAFTRGEGSTNKFVGVFCRTSVYRSNAAAAQLFERAGELLELLEVRDATPAPLDREIGDEADAFSALTDAGVHVFVVVWRSANVLSTCSTAAFNTDQASLAVELAEKQQARIADELD